MLEDKIEFLKKIAHGLRDLMEYTKHANRVGREPGNDIEHWIKRHILIRNHDNTYEFSVGKFRLSFGIVGDDAIMKMLLYLDEIGITIDRALTTAFPNPLYFSKSEFNFAHLINTGDIKTFYDFLIY